MQSVYSISNMKEFIRFLRRHRIGYKMKGDGIVGVGWLYIREEGDYAHIVYYSCSLGAALAKVLLSHGIERREFDQECRDAKTFWDVLKVAGKFQIKACYSSWLETVVMEDGFLLSDLEDDGTCVVSWSKSPWDVIANEILESRVSFN